MSEPLAFRPYTDADFGACLQIFRSNVPRYFAQTELHEFASFLETPNGEYLVAEQRSNVIACGGSYVQDGVGRLCWGMVEQAKHRSSIGSALLVKRLDILFSLSPEIIEVGIDTSQNSAGFFERFGFRTQRVTPDGFAEDLDCVAMVLLRENWLTNTEPRRSLRAYGELLGGDSSTPQ